MATDPVCGMEVDEQKAPATSEVRGRMFFFCSQQCKLKFDQNQEQYSRKAA